MRHGTVDTPTQQPAAGDDQGEDEEGADEPLDDRSRDAARVVALHGVAEVVEEVALVAAERGGGEHPADGSQPHRRTVPVPRIYSVEASSVAASPSAPSAGTSSATTSGSSSTMRRAATLTTSSSGSMWTRATPSGSTMSRTWMPASISSSPLTSTVNCAGRSAGRHSMRSVLINCCRVPTLASTTAGDSPVIT